MQGPGALVASLGKEPHFRPLIHTPGVFLLLLALHWVWPGLSQSHIRFSELLLYWPDSSQGWVVMKGTFGDSAIVLVPRGYQREETGLCTRPCSLQTQFQPARPGNASKEEQGRSLPLSCCCGQLWPVAASCDQLLLARDLVSFPDIYHPGRNQGQLMCSEDSASSSR